MKNLLLILTLAVCLSSCYDDSYLNPELDQTIAYFASDVDYTRTLVVGEGLDFKIGAAMAGRISNDHDRDVEYKIYQSGEAFSEDEEDVRELMPTDYYNGSELSGSINAVIPAGSFLGYFTVKMDSANFLSDTLSLSGAYTLPVKLVSTSLDTIYTDSINVSVLYMAGIDGYYLSKSNISKEINGSVVEGKAFSEAYNNEADENTWRLSTIDPFSVNVTPATSSYLTGKQFNMTVKDGSISVESIDGFPSVELEGTNTYDTASRDFNLNYKYQELPVDGVVNDTIYHVSTELIFRNRVRDGVNETRSYLDYLYN